MKYSIYAVDDDESIRDLYKYTFEPLGYECRTFHSAEELFVALEKNLPNVLLMDVMLPGMDGISAVKILREQYQSLSIIIVSAKSDEISKVRGLDSGADDYLTKPFSLNELMARVHSLIRRYTQFNHVSCPDTDTLTFQGMTIDTVNRIVEINGIRAELTGKEFDLLSFLASNKGSIFTKKQIYNQVWEEEYAFDDSNIMSFVGVCTAFKYKITTGTGKFVCH